MAYRKQVYGRSYPFIYNVTSPVGAYKSLKQNKVTDWAEINMPKVDTTKEPYQVIYQKERIPAGSHMETIQTSTFQPNKRDDVMLVQYLLKRVYQQGHNVQPPLNQTNGAAQLKIDGWYGPKTQSAIEHFQIELRRNGRNIATDGCIDPERGDTTTASISRTDYTISWLNKYFWLLYPALAPNIASDPECPRELKLAIGGF